MRLKAYLENLGVKVCLLSMDNFFLPLAERPKDLTDWESPLCVNRQLLLGTIEKLSNGETVQVPWYDFPNNPPRRHPPKGGQPRGRHHRRGHPHAQSPALRSHP